MTLRITEERVAEIAAHVDEFPAASDIPDLLADRAALLAEVEQLRAVIDGLPHAPGCAVGQYPSVECDCGMCRDPHAAFSLIERSVCSAPRHYAHAHECAVANAHKLPPLPCSCGKESRE